MKKLGFWGFGLALMAAGGGFVYSGSVAAGVVLLVLGVGVAAAG